MKILKIKQLLTICVLFHLFISCWAQGNITNHDHIVNELLDNIKQSEQHIKDMQMHVTWFEPETNNKLVVFQWGFENGKEFIRGNKWSGTDKDEPTAEIRYAFDGEKQRNFRHNTGRTLTTGGVYGFTPTTFSVYGTPKTLLGYSIKQKSQETFGQILSKTERTTIKEEMEEANGHLCHVIEAIGVQDGKNIFDIRAWIDAKRNFRPLKIEKFKRSEVHDRWQLLSQRIDNIELKEIDGIWFPVQGERQYFRTRYLPPENMTESEFEKAFSHLPIEEQRKKQRLITTPRHPKRKIEVDVNTIKINQGITPEMFTVKFPIGCRVWDDFLQIGYKIKVPQLDEQVLLPLSRDSLLQEEDILIRDATSAEPRGEKFGDTTSTKNYNDNNYSKNGIAHNTSRERVLHQPNNKINLILIIFLVFVFLFITYLLLTKLRTK